MAKNKPKINNQVIAPRYRVRDLLNEFVFLFDGGSRFTYSYNVEKFLYTEYKNNKFNMVYEVPDYSTISSVAELFQDECVCEIPMDFNVILQIQKAIRHHVNNNLYPSKREQCGMKIDYIIDVSNAIEFY